MKCSETTDLQGRRQRPERKRVTNEELLTAQKARRKADAAWAYAAWAAADEAARKLEDKLVELGAVE